MGDFFDRGSSGLAVLDLVISLQQQAKAAGGSVDSVIGNHDALIIAARGARGSCDPAAQRLVSDWVRNGGCMADLDGLTNRHIEWLVSLPAMVRLGHRLLVRADATLYLELGDSVQQVNTAFSSILRSGDFAALDQFMEAFSRRGEFADGSAVGASGSGLGQFLQSFTARQVIHGHTPISLVTSMPPDQVMGPLMYARGRCVNVDGGMYLGGPGFLHHVAPEPPPPLDPNKM